jgi:hypothetical protein
MTNPWTLVFFAGGLRFPDHGRRGGRLPGAGCALGRRHRLEGSFAADLAAFPALRPKVRHDIGGKSFRHSISLTRFCVSLANYLDMLNGI